MWNHLQQRFSVLPIQWAKTLWSRVTSSAINPDSEIGRLSRLLNGALLIIITLGIISEVEFVTRVGRFNVTDALAAATLLLLLLAYFLNRSGYFKTAAALTIGSIVFAMYAILWFNREEKDAAYILLYLILPILMGEFLLSPRAHAVTVALILAGVAGFFPLPGTVDTFMFLAIFSALMRLTSNYRRELEKNRLQSLQEAERKYRTLVEKVPAITYINLVDKDAVPIYVSPQIQTILGVSPEEWIEGKLPFWQSLIHPDDRGLVRTNFDRLYATGESADTEYRVDTPGGRLVWIHDHAIMLWDTAGNPVSIQGVMYDVTERRQAEETIRANEKRLRALIENGQDNISLLSADGVLLWESPATIRTLGYAQDEFLGHNIFELMHPDDLHWTSDLYSKLIHKPGSREHGIFRLRHRDGTWRWNEAVVTNMLNEPGVNAIIVNYRDITERKRADAKIRQYADIVENIKLGLYVFHLEKRDDDSSLRLVLANPAALQISGTTADEVIGTYLDESFPDLREMGVPQKYAQVVRTGEALELEVIYYDDFQVMETVYAVKAFPLPDDHVGVAFESITERKKAEDELRASEERFRQLANNLEEVFWIADPQSKTDLYISPAYERVWGRPTDAQYQNPDTFIESVMPEDRDTVLTALGRQEQGEKTEMEYRISRPDGSVRWIWDRAFPIFDETGKLTRVAGIAADVTNRKQTEEALQDREQRLQAIIFASPLAIISYHADGTVKAWNPAAERMFGWSETETLGQLPPLITEADLEEFHSLRERVIGGETILGIELKRHKKDSTLVDVSVNLAPTSDLDGQVDGYISLIEDITERRRAEETLRESEARYRGLFENLVNGFALHHIITDDQGQPVDYVFLEVNPAFEKLTGISAEQAIGRRVTEVLPGIENDPFIQIYGQVALTGEPVHLEEFSSSLNKYYEINAYSPARGQFAVTFADITERKLAEKEITRNLLELEALHENGLAISRLLEPHEIGDKIIETFESYLSWHHVTIRLRKEDTDDLELIAFNVPSLKEEERAEVEKIFNSRINKVGQGMSGWVVQTGRPIRTGDVRDHSQYVGTHAGIQSGLYMPLKIGERTIGCISVESESADAFSAQDERLLATLANQAAIAFENGRLYQAVQLDLMERRRIEDELRASQERYQTLVETSPDGIGMITLGGTVLFANEKMVDLFKTTEPSELIGSNLPYLFAPEEQTRMIENLGKAISQGSDFNEYWMTRRDHSRFYGDVRIRMTRDRMGQPDKAILQIRDITERKRTQTAIQEERQHFLNMFENSPVATWLEDFGAVAAWMDQLRERGIEDLRNYLVSHPEEYRNALSMIRIIDVNQAAVLMNEAKSKTHLLENVHRLMIEETPSQSLIIEFLMLWKGHTSFEFELTNRTLEGKLINAILHIYIPFTDGKPDLTRVIVTSTDITERKQMEIALQDERNLLAMRVEERTADLSRANDNLARALRVKDEFLANMSHELRTPLNAILGLSESLAEQIAGPLNNKQQNYVSTIGESGHHLLALINDILDLAKIEAGQITLDITKVDVHSVCQASLRMIKQQAQKKNQDVTLEIDEKFGLIWADERRLKQMIVNLMSNAVKFTPENGKIGLEVHGDQGENRVLITVWDSGIGIEENNLSQLFQPFVQLDAGLARETSGTGLGLALVAQMARLHGGSVSVASTPGEGSRFTLVIPWQPALSADTIERMKVTGKFRAIKLNAEKQETILLIEDTEEVILVVRDYLQLSGYNVVVAKDGLDGITQAKLIHPDLILMDIQMPRMNGIEATQKLRSDPDFQYTPIIALTALAMPNDRARCLAAGMDEYITKPVNLRALIKIIQGFLSHNQE